MESSTLQSTEQDTILKVSQLSKSYPTPEGKLDVLHDLNFSVKRSEFVSVIGPSGSGKTTLLTLLGALDTPDEGEIWLDDIAVHTLRGTAAARFRRNKIGFVFQLFYLLPNLTALENVMAPLLPFRQELDFDLKQRATELLEHVKLGHRLDHLPSKLSGGEQQRVAIARALIHHPSVLLADEPTGNLDPATGLEVLDILRGQQREGHQTLILVTHDPVVAAQADRRIRLRTSITGLEIEDVEELRAITPRQMYIPSSDDESVQPRKKKGISRRSVTLGIAGVVGLAAIGSAVWFITQSHTAPGIGDTLYVYHGHGSNVTSASWSPDGTYIASASSPLTVNQWENATTLQRQDAYNNVQSGHADSTVQVWNATTGHRTTTYHGHNGGIGDVAWSSDGKRLASSGLYDGAVRLWDAFTGKDSITHTNGSTNTSSKTVSDAIWAIAWSPDATHLASGDESHSIQVWDAVTGKVAVTYDKHKGPINAVMWSLDGSSIASASSDGTVHIWDATTGQQRLVYTGHTGAVNTVAWATDGQSLVSAGADRVIRVWESGSGNPIWNYNGHTASINQILWSPDGTHLASASDDNTTRLWDDWNHGTGKLLYTYRSHTAPVLTITWSADSTRIASGGSDKTVHIWLASNAQNS